MFKALINLLKSLTKGFGEAFRGMGRDIGSFFSFVGNGFKTAGETVVEKSVNTAVKAADAGVKAADFSVAAPTRNMAPVIAGGAVMAGAGTAVTAAGPTRWVSKVAGSPPIGRGASTYLSEAVEQVRKIQKGMTENSMPILNYKVVPTVSTEGAGLNFESGGGLFEKASMGDMVSNAVNANSVASLAPLMEVGLKDLWLGAGSAGSAGSAVDGKSGADLMRLGMMAQAPIGGKGGGRE